MRKCKILSVDINVTNMSEVKEYVNENINNIKGQYICVANVHTTVMAYEDKYYNKVQNSAIIILPDGKPLSIVSKLRGHKNAERVTGPDLMGEIFRESERNGYTHFFYGSTEETLNLLLNKLSLSYPHLKIVGTYSPPFRKLTVAEDAEVIDLINKSGADFLWIGLGAPKQEIWMHEHKERINSLMIGVGAGFDYYAGNIKRAPKLMQDFSLEWLYRLYQDPKRLFKRYLSSNTKFLFYNFKEKLKHR